MTKLGTIRSLLLDQCSKQTSLSQSAVAERRPAPAGARLCLIAPGMQSSRGCGGRIKDEVLKTLGKLLKLPELIITQRIIFPSCISKELLEVREKVIHCRLFRQRASMETLPNRGAVSTSHQRFRLDGHIEDKSMIVSLFSYRVAVVNDWRTCLTKVDVAASQTHSTTMAGAWVIQQKKRA